MIWRVRSISAMIVFSSGSAVPRERGALVELGLDLPIELPDGPAAA
jgi:hypothetical protein